MHVEAKNFALFDAASLGNISKLKEILANGGIDINTKFDKTQTDALHVATKNNRAPTVKFLLQNGADPNANNRKYETPLHVAAKEGSLEALRELLEYGCQIEKRDSKSYTPLFTACENGHVDVVKELIAGGANIFQVEATRRTLLHVTGNKDIIMILVQKGLHVDAKDMEGNTPLHAAAILYNQESIDALLQLGANPMTKDKDGKTALVLVEKQMFWQTNKEPVKLLHEAQKTWIGNPELRKNDLATGPYENRSDTQSKENIIKMPNVKESVDHLPAEQHKDQTQRQRRCKSSKSNKNQNKTTNSKTKTATGNEEDASSTQQKRMTRRQRKNVVMADVDDKTLALVSWKMTDDDANALPVDKHKMKHLKKNFKDDEPLRHLNTLRHLKQRYPHRKAFDVLKNLKRELSLPNKEIILPEEYRSILEEEELTTERLIVISRTLPDHYFHFGLLIGLSYDKMTEIELNYRGDSEEQCYQTLVSWKERFPNGKCAPLIEAIMRLDLHYESTINSIVGYKVT